MCYNVATPTIWRNIFEINSIEDIINNIKTIYNQNTILEGHGNTGWFIDQLILYNKVMDWNSRTNNFICLKESYTRFNRLDRDYFDINNINDINIQNNIKNGVYSDYHCFSMSRYSDKKLSNL